MSKVFIGYRHVSPDADVAKLLDQHLSTHGHTVFVDTKMEVGTRWIEEIENQLRAAAYFIVLLSPESIRSAMVRREVALAHQLSIESNLKILPIRLAWNGLLPYDLASYLDPIQYAFWSDETSASALCREVLRAIESGAALPATTTLHEHETVLTPTIEPENTLFAPLPFADLRLTQETEAIRPRSPFYVRREADGAVEGLLSQPGITVVLRGPHQFGKSSLFARAYASARDGGLLACYIDFKLVEDSVMADLGALARYIVTQICRVLPTSSHLHHWDERLGPKENLTHFIDTVLTSHPTANIALFLDDADRLFGRRDCEAFFEMVRAWHDRRAFFEPWERLTLLIAHSTTPALWIRNPSHSPFNVGSRLRLRPFTPDHIHYLDRLHGRTIRTDTDMDAFMQLLGGQPYLVRQALYALAKHEWSIAQFNDVAADNSGPFGDHLRDLLWALKTAQLDDAMRSLLRHQSCDGLEDYQRLEAAGLITGSYKGTVRPANLLYLRYFSHHL